MPLEAPHATVEEVEEEDAGGDVDALRAACARACARGGDPDPDLLSEFQYQSRALNKFWGFFEDCTK